MSSPGLLSWSAVRERKTDLILILSRERKSGLNVEYALGTGKDPSRPGKELQKSAAAKVEAYTDLNRCPELLRAD